MRYRCIFWEIIMGKEENKKSIDKKISTVKFECSHSSHLAVNQAKCAKCKQKPCLFICPANVYVQDEETKEIIVQYENCLECGACKIVCPKKTIEWNYPSSSFGVIYKNS